MTPSLPIVMVLLTQVSTRAAKLRELLAEPNQYLARQQRLADALTVAEAEVAALEALIEKVPPTDPLLAALRMIPPRWFLVRMGESVKPTRYAGDEHENTGEGFFVELQHRRGGLLTRSLGPDLMTAVVNAVKALPLDRAKEVYGD